MSVSTLSLSSIKLIHLILSHNNNFKWAVLLLDNVCKWGGDIDYIDHIDNIIDDIGDIDDIEKIGGNGDIDDFFY